MGNSNSNGQSLLRPDGFQLEDGFSFTLAELLLLDQFFTVRSAPGVF
ncbi:MULTISPECIES: hypothetical protein [Streptosporangium]|uniref:Uncharacterized protein n=1 Tax=Streptosporangium brasiliense TaxID=47480 RepID=A0ABT9RCP5_9ACTN|nr:hypothetical protein [Streptosporangium brasiliense]MDP9867026.1 hypothetical protein [Streptosporangium brasiliense]